MNKLNLTLIAGLFITVFSSGCSTYTAPRFDAYDQTLLILPFRDLKNTNGWYGWSNKGRQVAGFFKEDVESVWGPGLLIENTDARDFFEKVEKWATSPDISESDWRKLVKGVPADLVLVGEIRSMRYSNPNEFGILRGQSEWQYRVYRTIDGKRLYSSGHRKTTYPKQQDVNVPLTAFDTDRKIPVIRQGLLRTMGRQISKDLYGYFEEDHAR